MHVAALSLWQSIAPLHLNPCSKLLLDVYPHVLPHLWCINICCH